jgi:hypothetical protein
VFVFNSHVLLPLQLLLLQAAGHLEFADPMRPPRRPHNPLAFLRPLLQRLMRTAAAAGARRRRRRGASAGAVDLAAKAVAAAEEGSAPAAAMVAGAAGHHGTVFSPEKQEDGAQPSASQQQQQQQEKEEEARREAKGKGGQDAGVAKGKASEEPRTTAEAGNPPPPPPPAAAGPPALEDVLSGEQQGAGPTADGISGLRASSAPSLHHTLAGTRGSNLRLPPQHHCPAPSPPTPLTPVCRLPSLGKLFMLHLGPNPPPGQEAAASSGAFRVPFQTGEADR